MGRVSIYHQFAVFGQKVPVVELHQRISNTLERVCCLLVLY